MGHLRVDPRRQHVVAGTVGGGTHEVAADFSLAHQKGLRLSASDAAVEPPLTGDFLTAVERLGELNDGSVLLLKLPNVLCVVHDQLSEGGKLLTTVQVIAITRVLNAYMCNVFTASRLREHSEKGAVG